MLTEEREGEKGGEARCEVTKKTGHLHNRHLHKLHHDYLSYLHTIPSLLTPFHFPYTLLIYKDNKQKGGKLRGITSMGNDREGRRLV